MKLTVKASILLGLAASMLSAAAYAADKPKVLVIYPYLGDQSFVRMHKASEEEAKKYPDVKIDIVAGPDRTNANYFITAIEKAMTEGYNVIAINHGGAAAQLYPALNKAEAQGIKVVGFDTGLPELKGHASDVLYDIPGASGKAGELFSQIVPEGAKIGIIRCLLGNPDTDAFINGFKKATESKKYNVVMDADAKCDPASARTITENMLTSAPDLGGIFNVFDVSAQGSLQALKASGSKVPLGSIGGQLYGAEAVAAGGNWKYTVPYPFEAIGATAVDTAVKVAKNQAVEPVTVVPVATPLTNDNAGAYVTDLKAKLAAK
ncbi:sugar ABC transporter substrate-binding protein [Rhizobium sp. NLR17b]|uniref:sugar ABC transporter substrate-binding protein n=1 Tax=Rhizobium sp. NLR17b TaxID=2731114 RepID=UPI001C82B33C|nr:sugar ABC transporter substrate-binding protein [Rhizobium sp. NLR17b]MBX5272686.1 sugar ABC transporter substrate-binding protein [Rhizobium sp. NLR17b]